MFFPMIQKEYHGQELGGGGGGRIVDVRLFKTRNGLIVWPPIMIGIHR